MPSAVKICGLNTAQAVRAVNEARADYAGFVFFALSPRHLSLEHAAGLKAQLAPDIRAVSVLVDPDDGLVARVMETLAPGALQLHGDETPGRTALIKRQAGTRIIKAIKVASQGDVHAARRYEGVADMLLFDARAPQGTGALPGGNGLSFDWSLLKGGGFTTPWFLSGGLTHANVAEAIRLSGAAMVDVSSGVESSAGVKDPALIRQFVEAARGA